LTYSIARHLSLLTGYSSDNESVYNSRRYIRDSADKFLQDRMHVLRGLCSSLTAINSAGIHKTSLVVDFGVVLVNRAINKSSIHTSCVFTDCGHVPGFMSVAWLV